MKRYWLLGIVTAAFGWIVYSRHAEIAKLASILLHGRLHWVLIALGLQVVYFFLQSVLYHFSFRTVGVKSRLRNLLPLVVGSVFVNVVTPVASTSGPALFIDDAARNGESPARTAAGTLLMRVAAFGTFGLVLIGGLIALSSLHALKAYQLATAGYMVIKVGFLCAVLLLGLWWPGMLHRVLQYGQRAINFVARLIKRPEPISADWADKHAKEYADAAGTIRKNRLGLLATLGVAMLGHAVSATSLLALLFAFGTPFSLGLWVAGYAMGMLFWITSPAPEGVGIVESMMAVVYGSLGLPMAKATVVALAFRGMAFWLPFVAGFLLLHRLKLFGGKGAAVEAAPPVATV